MAQPRLIALAVIIVLYLLRRIQSYYKSIGLKLPPGPNYVSWFLDNTIYSVNPRTGGSIYFKNMIREFGVYGKSGTTKAYTDHMFLKKSVIMIGPEVYKAVQDQDFAGFPEFWSAFVGDSMPFANGRKHRAQRVTATSMFVSSSLKNYAGATSRIVEEHLLIIFSSMLGKSLFVCILVLRKTKERSKSGIHT
jgi:hypothetical protein